MYLPIGGGAEGRGGSTSGIGFFIRLSILRYTSEPSEPSATFLVSGKQALSGAARQLSLKGDLKTQNLKPPVSCFT